MLQSAARARDDFQKMLLPAGWEVRPADTKEQPLVQQGPTIPELYPRTEAADPNSNYDASLFTPQVLKPRCGLLCSGGNLPQPCIFMLLLPGMQYSWVSYNWSPSCTGKCSCSADLN